MWNQKGGKNEKWEWDIVNVNCTVNFMQSFLEIIGLKWNVKYRKEDPLEMVKN